MSGVQILLLVVVVFGIGFAIGFRGRIPPGGGVRSR